MFKNGGIMSPKKSSPQDNYVPNPDVMKLWPDISGNTINGLGESEAGRPRPVFCPKMAPLPTGR